MLPVVIDQSPNQLLRRLTVRQLFRRFGFFYSYKCRREMFYESEAELRNMLWLEFNDDVVSYLTNIKTYWPKIPNTIRYTPDVYLYAANGEHALQEVKEWLTETDKVKYKAIADWFWSEHKTQLELVISPRPAPGNYFYRNLDQLYPSLFTSGWQQYVAVSKPNRARVRDYFALAEENGLTRHSVLASIFGQHLVADLTQRITLDTVFEVRR